VTERNKKEKYKQLVKLINPFEKKKKERMIKRV
jgi:hypothetical protein